MKDDGNAQPGVLNEEPLDGVGEFRRGPGVLTSARVAGTSDLADPCPCPKAASALPMSKLPSPSTSVSAFGLPDAHHLRRLFFESHPGQQVSYPYSGGQRRISIAELGWGTLSALRTIGLVLMNSVAKATGPVEDATRPLRHATAALLSYQRLKPGQGRFGNKFKYVKYVRRRRLVHRQPVAGGPRTRFPGAAVEGGRSVVRRDRPAAATATDATSTTRY